MLKKEIEHIQVGELEIPVDYWEIDEEQKKELCLTIMDAMLRLLEKHINKNIDSVYILNKILESSIMVNLKDEQYEIVDVMTNIQKLLNEPRN